jgi:hypothetical protein
LLNAAGQDFVKAGNTMRVMLDQQHAEKFIKELLAQEIPLVASTFKIEAKQVLTTLKNQITLEMTPEEKKNRERSIETLAQVSATLRTKGQESRLYANSFASGLLAEIVKVPEANDLAGVTFTSVQAKEIAGILTNFAVMIEDEDAANAIIAFADLLEEAANAQTNVVIVNRELPGAQPIVSTIRHEESHNVQKVLKEENPAPLDTSTFSQNASYVAVRSELLKLGYNDNAELLINEAAVRIIANQLSSIGLNKESAHELLDLYFDMIENAYGRNAVKRFKHIHPSFKRLRDERSRKSPSANSGFERETQTGSNQDQKRSESGGELYEAGESTPEEQRSLPSGVRQDSKIDDDTPQLEMGQKLRQIVEIARKEEKHKNESGFFRIRSDKKQTSSYVFKNEERESPFQQARKSI